MGPKRKIARDNEEGDSFVKKRRSPHNPVVNRALSKRKAVDTKEEVVKNKRVPVSSEAKKKASANVKSSSKAGNSLQNGIASVSRKSKNDRNIVKDTKNKKKILKKQNNSVESRSDDSDFEARTKQSRKVLAKTIAPAANKTTRKNVNVKSKGDGLLPKQASTPVKRLKSESSSSESEWEDVAEGDVQDIDDYEPEIPKEGVEITLEGPKLMRRRKKSAFDVMAYIRRQVNRERKDRQLVIHQVHLLSLLARGLYVNSTLNSDDIKAVTMSLIPIEFFKMKVSTLNTEMIRTLLSWFRSTFMIQANFRHLVDVKRMMGRCFEYRKAPSSYEYNMMFVSVVRTLKIKARLCISFYPVSFKPTDLIKKAKPADDNDVEKAAACDASTSKSDASKPGNTKKEKVKKNVDKVPAKRKATRNAASGKLVPKTRNMPQRALKKVAYKLSDDDSDNDDIRDKDFEDVDDSDLSSDNKHEKPQSKKSTPRASLKTTTVKNRKILSSEEESAVVECWVEIFSPADQKWICVECSENVCNKPYDIERVARQPVTYVVAFDNDSKVKDVTKRYCCQWMTYTRKLRVEPDWWEDTLEPFLPPDTKLDRDEDSQMEVNLLRKPMPSTIGEFKNHPLYVLKRHLLKFQAIYPADAPSVGFMRGEPVYARECVHTLHSRETWLKEARMVRIGEEPYKIVKARPKWDKMAGVVKTDLPLHLFGFWQTEKYMPPVAWNGKVPRNEYGNVELFKPCMLPVGTVHLRNPGLNRVAKKLDIDCCAAVVGFDGHKGSIHPVFDGFIVCEEFKETILAAWEEEQENIRKREKEKREKRVYGNWKKLIKGLLIRERIKARYLTN